MGKAIYRTIYWPRGTIAGDRPYTTYLDFQPGTNGSRIEAAGERQDFARKIPGTCTFMSR